MGLLDTILSALGLKKSVDVATAAHNAATDAGRAAGVVEDDDDDDDDDEDDDGFERDYDLEAKDDMASFNFHEELEPFFLADFKIEQSWEDEDERRSLFVEYGIRNEQHYYQVKATLERYMQSPQAAAKWGDVGDIMQIKMNATTNLMRDQMAGRASGELAAELEPVEGVSLEQWAKAQASVATGGNTAEIIAGLGVDQAKWDRVSAEWNARMSRDTTVTIATEYGKHFQSAGVGQFAGAAAAGADALATGAALEEKDAPIPFEKYVEIEQAQGCGVEQGKDAAGILQSFGMTPVEWGQVGGWWSQFISQNAMKNNGALHKRYTQLQEQFEAKYKAGGADTDISF